MVFLTFAARCDQLPVSKLLLQYRSTHWFRNELIGTQSRVALQVSRQGPTNWELYRNISPLNMLPSHTGNSRTLQEERRLQVLIASLTHF